MDDEPFSNVMLAALPRAQRKAVAAARRVQLLATVRECIAQRWAGGFLALRHFVAGLLGLPARLWTEPLALRVLLGRTGGIATVDSVESQLYHARALSCAGEHAKAASLLRACLEVDATRPAGELLPQPAATWYRLGVEETDALDIHASLAAFRSGLDAHLSTRPTDPNGHSYDVDELRFLLLSAIVVATFDVGQLPDAQLLLRLFREHPPCKAEMERTARTRQPVQFRMEPRGGMVSAHVGGRVFVMTDANNRWRIEELPPGSPLPLWQACPTAVSAGAKYRDSCLPALPSGRCAACLAESRTLKQCQACRLVLYCGARRLLSRARVALSSADSCARFIGKDCQVRHWPEHKAACKAARKAAAAGAGAST